MSAPGHRPGPPLARRPASHRRGDHPGRRRPARTRVGLHAQPAHAGRHLRHRGGRARRRARLLRADLPCAGRVLRPRRLRHGARPGRLPPAVHRRLRRRRRHRGGVRPAARLRQPAPRRPLPGHGHHQLPADPDPGADQLDRLHPRPGRHPRHRPPGLVQGRRRLSLAVPRRPGRGHALCLAVEDQPPRPRHAGRARQRDRGEHLRDRRPAHQGAGIRHLRRARRPRRRAVRRRVRLYKPGPVLLRRIGGAAHHGAARRRAIAVRCPGRHGAAGHAAGMAAFPAAHLPRRVWRGGHPDHGVPAGRPVGAGRTVSCGANAASRAPSPPCRCCRRAPAPVPMRCCASWAWPSISAA